MKKNATVLLLLCLKMKEDIQCLGLTDPDAIEELAGCSIAHLVMRWHAVKDPPDSSLSPAPHGGSSCFAAKQWGKPWLLKMDD